MRKLLLVLIIFASCATGKNMYRIGVGMTKKQVLAELGKPKGYGADEQGEYFVYNYANHAALPLSGGRTNYRVHFKDGKVVSYGPQ